jgi:hypothetical protein
MKKKRSTELVAGDVVLTRSYKFDWGEYKTFSDAVVFLETEESLGSKDMPFIILENIKSESPMMKVLTSDGEVGYMERHVYVFEVL